MRAIAGGGQLGAVLQGPAIARFSGALFRDVRGRTRPDILGLALRFHPGPGAEPEARSQDLLLATFRHVWTLPIAMVLTRSDDYLANTYSTVLPSRVPGRRGVTFRVVPEATASEGEDPPRAPRRTRSPGSAPRSA